MARTARWPVAILGGLALLLAGCPLQPPPPFVAPPAAIHPDVASLAWLAEHWVSDDGTFEQTWVPAGDGLFGASFTVESGKTTGWEASIVALDEKGRLAYRSMPDGQAPVVFLRAASNDRAIRFTNLSNDPLTAISYARRDAGPIARLGLRLGGRTRNEDVALVAMPVERAPELEAADSRFAADVDARGTPAWVEVFDPTGGMENQGKRVEGAAAIRAAMDPLLSDRTRRLQWAPIASGFSPAGDVGYTVGAWGLARHARGEWTTAARGAYITFWRRGADGTWRVLFDAGDDEGPASTSPPDDGSQLNP